MTGGGKRDSIRLQWESPVTDATRQKLIDAVHRLVGVEGPVPDGVNLFGKDVSGGVIVDTILAEMENTERAQIPTPG